MIMKKTVLLILLILFMPIVSATDAGVTPDSFFYGFDVFIDKISVTLTFNKEKKAQKAIEVANERLEEAKQMAENENNEATLKAQDEYLKTISYVEKLSNKAKAKNKEFIQSHLDAHYNEVEKRFNKQTINNDNPNKDETSNFLNEINTIKQSGYKDSENKKNKEKPDEEEQEEKNEKVVICHIPPGNTGSAHTIEISLSAIDSHLAHGDYLGQCNETEPVEPPDCVSDADCDINETCANNVCIVIDDDDIDEDDTDDEFECVTDLECEENQECLNNNCVDICLDCDIGCVDSDEGKEFYVKGKTSLNDNSNDDYCNDWVESDWDHPNRIEQRVTEYYCENSEIKNIEFTCPMFASPDGLKRGCLNGACIYSKETRRRAMWVCYNGERSEGGSEYDCQTVSHWASLAHEFCKEKCNNDGKCGVKYVNPWVLCGDDVPQCVDSDEGKEPFIKGSANGNSDTCAGCDNEFSEFCFSGTQVIEQYCENDLRVNEAIDCPDGCVDGACIRLCEDTDVGIIYGTTESGWIYNKTGSATGYTAQGEPMEGTDYCNSDEFITEYACNAYGQVVERYRNCSDMIPGTVCQNGACVEIIDDT